MDRGGGVQANERPRRRSVRRPSSSGSRTSSSAHGTSYCRSLAAISAAPPRRAPMGTGRHCCWALASRRVGRAHTVDRRAGLSTAQSAGGARTGVAPFAGPFRGATRADHDRRPGRVTSCQNHHGGRFREDCQIERRLPRDRRCSSARRRSPTPTTPSQAEARTQQFLPRSRSLRGSRLPGDGDDEDEVEEPLSRGDPLRAERVCISLENAQSIARFETRPGRGRSLAIAVPSPARIVAEAQGHRACR